MMRADRHTAKRASCLAPSARCLLLSLAISASPSLAGGTLDTGELRSLLQQQPEVLEALTSALNLAETAHAEARLGSHYVHLGGTRVGPYTIKATLKQSRKDIEVVLCAQARFFSRDGAELPAPGSANAVRIEERLIAVLLRAPSPASAGHGCA